MSKRGMFASVVTLIVVAAWLVVEVFDPFGDHHVFEPQRIESVTLVAPVETSSASTVDITPAPVEPQDAAPLAVSERPIPWSVRAVVHDEDGLPIPGARLTLAPTPPERRPTTSTTAWEHLDEHMPSTSATSDVLGFVTLLVNGPRTSIEGLELTLEAPGYAHHLGGLWHRGATSIDFGVVTMYQSVAVVGRVTSEAGEALADVEITAVDDNVDQTWFSRLPPLRMAKATSDDEGMFRLDVPAGRALSVTARSRHDEHKLQIEKTPSSGVLVIDDIALLNAPIWTATVTILDPDGRPVEGARLERSFVRFGVAGDLEPLFTDVAGVATIESWKKAKWASHDVFVEGYARTRASPTRGTNENVVVTLTEPITRMVQVVDADTKAPLDAVDVVAWEDGSGWNKRISPASYRARDQLAVHASTDDHSSWTILGEPEKPGEAQLQVRVHGRPDIWFPWPEDGDTLPIPAPASLDVTLVAPHGPPLPGTAIMVRGRDFQSRRVTDIEGRATFTGLPAGRLIVSAKPWPYDDVSFTLNAIPGEDLTAEVAAVEPSRLVIHAHDPSGAPLSVSAKPWGYGLEVVRVESEDYLVGGHTCVAPGRHEARGLSAGRYRATWEPGGLVELDIRDGELTEVSLTTREWSQLTGTVTRDGVPYEGASIDANPFWPDIDPDDALGLWCGTGLAGAVNVPEGVVTDANGRWHLDELVGMQWKLTVSLGGASSTTETITVGYDETLVFEHDLTAHPIGGRVESEDGLPLVGATVFATPKGGTTTTDEFGRFELPDASPAAELLHVSAAEHALIAPRPLGADRSREVVVLAEAVSVAYTVEGRLPNIRRLDKPDAPRLRIRAISADDWIEVAAKRRGPLSLALGRHEIELVVDGVVEDRVELDVVPGGDLSITLTRGALQR